jgi:hypothetical protein
MQRSPERRFKSLSNSTNRQYAYAIVFGDADPGEASAFGVWVLRHGLNTVPPEENWSVFHSDAT